VLYVNLQSTIMPHILLVIKKCVHPFDLVYFDVGGLHQTLVYLVLNGFSLLLIIYPCYMDFPHERKI